MLTHFQVGKTFSCSCLLIWVIPLLLHKDDNANKQFPYIFIPANQPNVKTKRDKAINGNPT